MNLIELYDKNGKVGSLINGDKIESVFPVVVNGVDQSEISTLNETFHSYETMENFQKRIKEQWVELKCGEKPIKVRPSEIAAYREFDGKIHFWLRGIQDSFLCAESIESFERKLGIRKEETK